MCYIKQNLALIFFAVTINSCLSQKATHTQDNNIKFEKIIFHSTRCFGTCPRLDFEVDSNGYMKLSRELFKTKSETDTAGSGNFSGMLPGDKFNDLLRTIVASKYDSLIFPPVFCCDGSVTTIIIYMDNKRTYLKSMFPPDEARPLIKYLREFGLTAILPKTEKEISIEE